MTRLGADGGKRGRVLVIDDEPALLAVLCRMLSGEHEVIVSTSGAAALDRIEAGEYFDIILCDLMMPVMTGMEVYAKLSRIAPEQLERLVFLTGGAFTST